MDDDQRLVRERRYAAYLDLDRLFPLGPFEANWIADDTLWYLTSDAADDGPAVCIRDLVRDRLIGPIPCRAIGALLDPSSGRELPGLPFDRVELDGDDGIRFVRGARTARFDAGRNELDEEFRTQPVARPGTHLRRLFLAPPAPVPDVVSPDGARFATIREGDVWIVSCNDGRALRLTRDAVGDIGWDLESGRRPFAHAKATATDPWSPDGTRLFAARIDRTAVRRVPQIDFLAEDIRIGHFFVEAPRTPLPRFDFFLLDADGATAVRLDLGDTENGYLFPLGWMPDGSECWFARFSRDFARVDLLAVDATGAASHPVRTVLHEACDSFVRVQHELLYPNQAGFAFLPDSSGFLWLSERSGWKHLYRYDRGGAGVVALTAGDWPVAAIEGFDHANAGVLYTAHSDVARPYDTHLQRVELAGGESVRLTVGIGQHDIALSPSRRTFVDTCSTVSEPPVTTAHAADGRPVAVLRSTDIRTLRALGWTPPEEVVVKALDGTTDHWGVLYRPADFDPARRYPVVEHIYGGPQVAYAPHAFGLGSSYKPWNQAQALAQLGFVVIVIDTKGTPGRSKAFHDDVHGAMGRRQLDEHAAALRRIAADRPWMDLERVGVFGHSWGGYYAVRALVDAPDLYRVAVASGSALTAGHLMSEPYLGLISERPQAYADYDAVALAPRIRGHLLMVAGTAEASVFHDAMRMTHALIEAGIRHELIVLPGQPHGYAGKAADYFLDASTRFLQKHLGGERAA